MTEMQGAMLMIIAASVVLGLYSAHIDSRVDDLKRRVEELEFRVKLK